MAKKIDPFILKRQQQLNDAAQKYYNSLLTEFIKFKNDNFIEKKGRITLKPEAEAYQKMIIEKWLNYCSGMNRNSNRILNFQYTALPEAINNHIDSHKRLAFINHSMKLLAKISIKNPDAEELESLFNDKRSCRKAVIIYLFKAYKRKYKKLLFSTRHIFGTSIEPVAEGI